MINHAPTPPRKGFVSGGQPVCRPEGAGAATQVGSQCAAATNSQCPHSPTHAPSAARGGPGISSVRTASLTSFRQLAAAGATEFEPAAAVANNRHHRFLGRARDRHSGPDHAVEGTRARGGPSDDRDGASDLWDFVGVFRDAAGAVALADGAPRVPPPGDYGFGPGAV